MDSNLVEVKETMGYADMTEEQKTAFDERITARKADQAEADAEMKDKAGYHEMSDAEKIMYDTMLLAQKQLKADDKKAFNLRAQDDMTRDEFDAMTPEE